ncbi:MAG: tetratricopeptide repeat protein [Clostridiales Family XIII bacterium]|jgi:tetratricopeptide (TPR) repeat protein|nr:tetratricopeptide repeat protein [Clostridiales Family XIII bacterium]
MFTKKTKEDEQAASADADIRTRPDRVGKHLEKHLSKFVFDEFSDAYLTRGGISFMQGVPVPLRKEDMADFHSAEGLSALRIGENMAYVMGISPQFPYAGNYVKFLKTCFRGNAAEVLVREAKSLAGHVRSTDMPRTPDGSRPAAGTTLAEREEPDQACIYFRAALCMEPKNLEAMYGYAMACRAMYLNGGDSAYVGNLKAEALEYFELTAAAFPRFPMAHYYLGYAYLNLGLYQKAYLTWKTYLKYSDHAQDRKEIRERIRQLAEPLEIEKGCNAVLAGRWHEGIDILEPYVNGKYSDWWPLYYYLGAAYHGSAQGEEAEEMFKQALRLCPSHVESMDALAQLYTEAGEGTLAKKYSQKAALIRSGGHTS